MDSSEMEDISNHYLPVDTILYGQDYQYRILKVLGEGTFGITYLAKAKVSIGGKLGHLYTEIDVAIKEFFMKEMNTRTGDSVDSGSQSGMFHSYRNKFRKEAMNLSRMQHAGIVKVLEVFEQNNTSYIVMEFMNGGSLDAYIHKIGKIPEEEALQLISLVGNALEYMHDQRMLHLDLKPQNIMFNGQQQPVLIDFGLSKHYNESGEPESSTSIGMGTPGYSPLEQADYKEMKDFQPTLDIYALGATLYKMLTGQTPPTASTVLKHPSLLNDKLLQAGISQKCRDLVLAAMQPLKGARPQTVAEFLLRIQTQPQTVEEVVDVDDESTLVDIMPKSVKTPPARKTFREEDVRSNENIAPSISNDTDNKEKEKKVANHIEKNNKHNKNFAECVKIAQNTANPVVLPPTEVLLDILNKHTDLNEDYLPGHNIREYMNFYNKCFMEKSHARVTHIDGLKFQGDYAPLMYKGKYGFVNKDGVLVTEFKYDEVKFTEWGGNDFSIKYKGKWGLLDSKLNALFDCIYDHELIASEGMIAICKQGKWGFMDLKWCWEPPGWKSTVVVVIDCQYDAVGKFIDGLAMVKQNGLFGYIDKKGTIIIPIEYEDCHDERREKGTQTLVLKKDGRWEYTDLKGFPTLPLCLGNDELFEFHNQHAIIRNKGSYYLKAKWGTIQWSGQFIERREGEEVYRITSDNKYNLLNPDVQKQPLAKEWYDHIGRFVDDMAVVRRNGFYGVINTKGEEIIPCYHEWISAEPVDGWVMVKDNLNKWKLKILWNRKSSYDFTVIKPMDGHPYWYLTQQLTKFGLVDGKGDVVLPMIYDDIIPLGNELLIVIRNDKTELIHLPNVETSYNYSMEPFNEGLCRVTFYGKQGFLDKEGGVVIPFMDGMGDVNNTFKPFKNGLVCINGKFTNRQNLQMPVNKSKRLYLVKWITAIILVFLLLIGWAWIAPGVLLDDIVKYLGIKTLLLSVFQWIPHLIGWLGVYAVLGGMFTTSVIGCIWIIRQKFSKQALLPNAVFSKKFLQGFQDYAYLMTEGLLAVKKEGKWGFINAKGKTVIPCSYDWVSVFEKGIAQAMSGDKQITLDKTELRID